MVFIDKLGLIGQFIGVLALGMCGIVIIAYSWIYLMSWLKDMGVWND